MMQFLLLFSLILPAYATRSSNLEEREALLLLQKKFLRFITTAGELDADFAKLRAASERHRYSQAKEVSAEISRQISVSRRQWREVENYYDDAQRIRMNFHRQNLARTLNLDENFMMYLRFRHHDRFGTGVPLELQLAAWLGLHYGEKIENLPADLRRRGDIAGFALKPNDSLLLIMNDGGFIRGRYEGFSGDKVVIREVLPNTLGLVQRTKGSYRAVDFSAVARVEVIRQPPTISATESPPPVVTGEGNYSQYYASHPVRIDFRPDNMQLLKAVKAGRFAETEYEPKVTPVDRELEARPAYAELYFIDCEDLLRRTP